MVNLVLVLVGWVLLNGAPLFAAFHGIDDLSGKPVSRSSLDTQGPPNGFQVGLQILRFHGEKKVISRGLWNVRKRR